MTMYAQFDAEGFPVAFWAPFQPDRPFDVVEITDQQWRDMRSDPGAWRWDGTQVVPYQKPAAEALADWRAAAVMPKAAFLKAAQEAGYISTTDRLAAARGHWPEGLSGALATLTEDDRAEAEIAWAEATTVGRLHPTLALVQAHLALTDEQVDALFEAGE